MGEAARREVANYYHTHREAGKPSIVKYFMTKGLKRTFIYSVLRKVDNNWPLESKPIPGRPKLKLDPKRSRWLRRETEGKVAVSYKYLARRLRINDHTVKRIMSDMGIQKRTRKIVPRVSEKQRLAQKKRLNKARRGLLASHNGLDVVMDDESYFPLCRHQHKEYYYEGRQPAPDEVRYKQKGKFEPKVLVWIAISPRGRSRPVIFNSKLNVTAKVYQDKMIRPYLHPFLQEKYPTGGYVFWPDLARVHYAKSTVELLDELGILLLPKDQNPPAAPQIRPIELFRSHLKSRVYEGGWEAKTKDELEKRILEQFDSFDESYFVNLMKKVKRKVRKAADHGLISLTK